MRLDGATIAIEPRNVGPCLDLAVLFYRGNLRRVLVLTALFAVPCGFLTYALRLNLALSTALFYFISPFLGAALVTAAGHRAFGEPFRVGRAFRVLRSRFLVTAFGLIAVRFALPFAFLCLVLPALLLAARYGFYAEVLLLERVGGTQAERRLGELTRGAIADLAARLVALAGFGLGLFFVFFVLVDLAFGFLLGFPFFIDRWTWSDEFWWQDFSYYLFEDPRTVTALTSVAWLIYPLIRLAWFFCYIDLRIRKECWDVEIDFRVEAQRLEALAR